MNLEDYPTPETDAAWDANQQDSTEGDLWALASSLERRLALARDTLLRVHNEYMRIGQRNLLIDEAIRETNPQVDS